MSLTFFTEPFYSLADFDRLFDEAFNSRTSALVPRERNEAATRPMRPRYVSLSRSLAPPAFACR